MSPVVFVGKLKAVHKQWLKDNATTDEAQEEPEEATGAEEAGTPSEAEEAGTRSEESGDEPEEDAPLLKPASAAPRTAAAEEEDEDLLLAAPAAGAPSPKAPASSSSLSSSSSSVVPVKKKASKDISIGRDAKPSEADAGTPSEAEGKAPKSSKRLRHVQRDEDLGAKAKKKLKLALTGIRKH